MNELIAAYDEYIALLTDTEGSRASLVERAKELREKIERLKRQHANAELVLSTMKEVAAPREGAEQAPAEERLRIVDLNERTPVVPEVRRDVNWCLSLTAEWAKQMIMQHGLILAEPGQCRDSYQEMMRMTPAEAVERACQIAEAMFEAFEKHGWVFKVPFHDELVQQLERAGGTQKFRIR